MAASQEQLERAHAAALAAAVAEAEEKALEVWDAALQEATEQLRQQLESALSQLETAKVLTYLPLFCLLQCFTY
jgi:hypothetical protein